MTHYRHVVPANKKFVKHVDGLLYTSTGVIRQATVHGCNSTISKQSTKQ